MLAATACTDIIVYEVEPPSLSYYDGNFEYATHRGAILTRIGGNPFDMPADRFRALVRDHMRGANWGGPVEFTPQAGERTLPPYKVVAMFNLKRIYDSDDLCRGIDDVETVAPSPRGLRLNMAFCLGDAAKSAAWGTARNVSGPDDPKLRALIRQVTVLLVPTFTKQNTLDDSPVIP